MSNDLDKFSFFFVSIIYNCQNNKIKSYLSHLFVGIISIFVNESSFTSIYTLDMYTHAFSFLISIDKQHVDILLSLSG